MKKVWLKHLRLIKIFFVTFVMWSIPTSLISAAPLHQIDLGEQLLKQGLVLDEAGRPQEALAQMETALSYYRAEGNRFGEAQSLQLIGYVKNRNADFAGALDAFYASLSVWRKIGDRANEAVTLIYIGNIHRTFGKHEQALVVYQQALEIALNIRNQEIESGVLSRIGMTQDDLGQYDLALKSANRALTIAQKNGDRTLEGTQLNNIGIVYDHLGQYETALEYFDQALATRQGTNNRKGMGETLNNYGVTYYNMGQFEKALEYYQQSLEIMQEFNDQVTEATILGNIAEIYAMLGDSHQAQNYFQKAINIHRKIGAITGELISLNNLGGFYDDFGKYDIALEYYKQALALARDGGSRQFEGKILNNIGETYSNLGQYQTALDYFQQGLTISQQVGDKAGEGRRFTNLGAVYHNLGQYDQALNNYQKGLTIQQEIGDRVGVQSTLNNLGGTYLAIGQFDQAMDYFEKTLIINQEIGYQIGEGRAYSNIGTVFNSLEQGERAIENFQKALTIQQEIGDRAGEAQTLNNIGATYHKLRQNDNSLEYFQQALVIAQEIGSSGSEELAARNIGFLYDNLGKADQAINYYEQAVEATEQMQSDLKVEELQVNFTDQRIDVYGRLINLLWSAKRFEEVLIYSERSRARAFLNQVGNQKINFNTGLSAELMTQENNLRSEIIGLRNQLNKAYDNPLTELGKETIKTLKIKLAAREADYRAFLLEIKVQNPENASLISVDVASLVDIQGLLDDNTTLVEYVMTEERVYAFIITQSTFEHVALDVKPEILVETIINFRDGFANLSDGHPSSLQQLYTWLIAPLEPFLATSVLGIIPHNILHYVPFAALSNGSQYLSDKFATFVLPSASTLRFIQAKRKLFPGSVLTLGNPTSTENLSNLPFAQQETERIANLYKTQPLVGKDATEKVIWERSSNAGILHLAAHGQYKPTSPMFSAIYLVGDDQYDGRLEVHEIYNLDLTNSTNLVVLSACETNVGKHSIGDEIIGLNRAFLFAGTPSVISSLWSVDDAATGLLMEQFYIHLREGLTKAEALRQAQIDVRTDYPHPYYWAGFVLSGDGGTLGNLPSWMPDFIKYANNDSLISKMRQSFVSLFY